MGSSFKASSEAGTVRRFDTAESRMERVKAMLAKADKEGGGENLFSESIAVLSGQRSSGELYEITPRNPLQKIGKLDLVEATVDGKPIVKEDLGAANLRGIGRGTPESRRDFQNANDRLERQSGYILAHDGKDAYAIPHSWNVNNPALNVGIFRGDQIKYGDKTLTVTGTFDNSKRGLNLAGASVGDDLNRTNGFKQTAIILGNKGYPQGNPISSEIGALSNLDRSGRQPYDGDKAVRKIQ
jgi:hypothetical protein